MGSRLDAEYHAFRKGLRPAVRLSAEPGQSGRIVELYRTLGAAVVTAAGGLSSDQRHVDRAIEAIYVARTAAEAEALREAEAPLVGGARASIGEGVRATRAMGLGLGYPACCVEACCARYARRRENPGGPAQAYLAARDAWVPAPRWQLDDLLFAAHVSVISFEPCSYACDAATRYADAVLAVLGGVDRAALEGIERALRRCVALDARGGRAIVTLSGQAITGAEALRGDGGRTLSRENEALGPALAGRLVSSEGSIAGSGEPPALLLDFAGAGG
jgi:hypothetical protein